MSFKTEIEDKIIEVKKVISLKYPNHCRSCNGRGGVVVDWYEGTKKFSPCRECVGKGVDPLNVNLELSPPTDYGLYHYEDGEMWEAWFDLEDRPESWQSPTLNRELNSGWEDSWFDTPMGKVVDFQGMLRDLQELHSRFYQD
tara:strand:- start:646 stop:1071 length:426 start_codon:yes stop_codon:yes gene_type:complete